MHTAEEIGIDDFQPNRAPDKRYRTSPLKGLWTHTKRGFYHDGRFPTLGDVVDHYDAHFRLSLTGQEKIDLIEYLKFFLLPFVASVSWHRCDARDRKYRFAMAIGAIGTRDAVRLSCW